MIFFPHKNNDKMSSPPPPVTLIKLLLESHTYKQKQNKNPELDRQQILKGVVNLGN